MAIYFFEKFPTKLPNNKEIIRIILCTAHWAKFQMAITAAFDEKFVAALIRVPMINKKRF